MTDFLNPRQKKGRSNGLQAKRPRIVPEEQLEYDAIPICGVSVQLPQGLKPYPTQKLMMVRMLQSLDKQLNALLESPTGSGKTMALLASSCAWLVKYKEEAAKSKEECRVHGYSASAQSLNDTAKKNSAFIFTAHRSSDFPETSKSVTEKVETLKQTKAGPFYLIDEMEELNEDFYQPCASFVSAAHPNDAVYTEAGDAKVEGCTCKPKIRVYYGTRTHRQIAHVVKEYGRLPFGVQGTLRHTILASREQSCINEEVRKSGDMTSNCREKLEEKDGPYGCEFKQNINRAGCGKGPYMRSFVNQEGGGRVWDMEDLVDALRHSENAMCPNFASNRIMTMDADIIFCPYNYIPSFGARQDVHLTNSIVILDEAHNIEDTCREAASFSFSENEAYVASKDLLLQAKRFWKHARPNEMYSSNGDDVVVLDENSSTGAQPDVGDADARDTSLNLRQLADFAQRLYVWVTELSHATKKRNSRDDGRTYTQVMSGAELHATLQKAKIFLPEDSPTFKSLLCAFTKTAGMGDGKMGSFPTEKSLCKPSSTTLVTLQKFLCFSKFFGRTREFYK
ncbi:DOG-1 protein [Aphelenchoides avenae]|nr:DOG-1 protein [Aphelenchus avenae]